MKIFVSYSRRDAGDFANQIQSLFATFEQYEVFTDVNSIKVGDVWSDTIEDNISKCDIFMVIVTHGALRSPHVENEVLQAQRENKRIIPCFHRNVGSSDIKWGLSKIQGVAFAGNYDLVRDLYSKVSKIASDSAEDKPPSRGIRKLDLQLRKQLGVTPRHVGEKTHGAEPRNSNNANSWYEEGIGLGKSSKYEEAINYFDKAIEIDPNNADALTSKERALRFLGRRYRSD